MIERAHRLATSFTGKLTEILHRGNRYDTSQYYDFPDGNLVLAAHKKLRDKYFSPSGHEYWNRTERTEPGTSYHEETAGAFSIHTSTIEDMPIAMLAVIFDTTVKSYMDQGSLGKQDEKRLREEQLARMISIPGKNLLVTAVTHKGVLVGGGMRTIGEGTKTVGEILQHPNDREVHLPTLSELAHAGIALPENHPLLAVPEHALSEGIRYYVVPVPRLTTITKTTEEAARDLRRKIRPAIAGGLSKITHLWMKTTQRTILYSVSETPNPTLKREFEQQIAAGDAMLLGAVPENKLYGNTTFDPKRIHIVSAAPFSITDNRAQKEFANAFPR